MAKVPGAAKRTKTVLATNLDGTKCGARDSQYGGPYPPRVVAVNGYKPLLADFR